MEREKEIWRRKGGQKLVGEKDRSSSLESQCQDLAILAYVGLGGPHIE